MKTPCYSRFLFLLFILFTFTLFGQGKLNGVVYYQNSGGKPATGVPVSAFGSGSKYTTDSGMFTLTFSAKKPGDKVKMILGGSDSNGKSIEIVNTKQLEWLRIPKLADDEPIEIIVCYAGQRDKAALRYYGILLNANNKEFARQLTELESKLKDTNLDAQTTATLIKQIDELKVERDAAMEKIEQQAQFIATINQDGASDMVKQAIKKIEIEENVDSALLVLDNEKLEEAYKLALDKKIKAEREIKQVIEGYELKISLLEQQFKYGEAVLCFERIIEIVENNQFEQEKLAYYYWEIGMALQRNGKYELALDYHLKSKTIREEILDKKHRDLAQTYESIGTVYKSLGKYKLALENNLHALDIREKILSPKHIDLADSYTAIGMVYFDLGLDEKALEYILKTIDIQKDTLDAKHPDLANSYNNIALLQRYLGDTEKSLENNLKAVSIREEVLAPNHPDLAVSYTNIGLVYLDMGDLDKALEYHLKDVAILEKTLHPKHPDLGNSYNNIALVYRDSGNYGKALEYQLKDKAILDVSLKSDHPDLAKSSCNLGLLYALNNQFEEAKAALEVGIKYLPEHLHKYAHRNWGVYYAKKNDAENAVASLQKAIELGFTNLNWFKTQKALDNIREETPFQDMLKGLEKGS